MKKRFIAPFYVFILFTLVMIVLFGQFCYLSLSSNIYGINMKEFASNRNTVTKVLTANRGTIYDVEGNVLAQNITSYTLIAYLDPSRTNNINDPKHVVDKEYTAHKLATVLGEDNYEYILKRLNKDVRQVEFGKVGKNLTELTKIAIEELDLPGIDFVESEKRYYPNGRFASYIIGYSKQYTRINIKENDEYDLKTYYKNYFNQYDDINISVGNPDVVGLSDTVLKGKVEGSSVVVIRTGRDPLATILVKVTDYDPYNTVDNTIVGELGVESKYESTLQGTDGFISYQRDKNGYQIPDTPEIRVDAIDGSDIYLTIDSNIQRFAESAVMSVSATYRPEWTMISVMDAKSGSILASATSPSYNPNELTSDMLYQNPLVSFEYEPGSVMKIYTYMCAIETGRYNGEKKYLSGSYEVDEDTTIHDWNNKGWGYLNYDTGFAYSSNVAIINIINDYLSRKELKNCLTKYGFGEKTEIELSGESKGKVEFRYDSETYSAGYGQGITITAIQQLQALSIVANDGFMVEPHIISKIVDKENKIEKKTKTKKSERIVSSSTVSKIKNLMEDVLKPGATGSKYYIDGYDIIGKTGTAQIYQNGKYLTGENDYIVSAALMYPKDDPEIIVYSVAKRPKWNANVALANATVELIKNINKYKTVVGEVTDTESSDSRKLVGNYINKDTSVAISDLKDKNVQSVVMGTGDKVINQYPKHNSTVLAGDKVFLITNNNDYKMPDMNNWSRSDVVKFCDILNISCTFKNYGYVEKQNISKGTAINKDTKLEIVLGKLKVDE